MKVDVEFNHIGKGGEDRTQRPMVLVQVSAQKPNGHQITFPESGSYGQRNNSQQFICFLTDYRHDPATT
jgi:hypothetical protein